MPPHNFLTKRSSEDSHFMSSPKDSFKWAEKPNWFVPTRKHLPTSQPTRLVHSNLSAASPGAFRPFAGHFFSKSPPEQLFLSKTDDFFSKVNFKTNGRKRFFSKQSLLKSKRVCRKCKTSLRKNLKINSKTSVEKNRSTKEVDPDETLATGAVFTNSVQLQKLAQTKSVAKLNVTNQVAMDASQVGLKLRQLRRLSLLLVKFLMDDRIWPEELASLSKLETSILLLFVNKKKLPGKRISRLSATILEDLGKHWIPKRFEENLRFVVNKAFKFLTKSFNDHLFYSLEQWMRPEYRSASWNSRFDYAFYGFYFQKVSACIRKPLEIFFHPKSRKNVIDNAEMVPKTISQYYLNLVCTSDVFKRDLKGYLDNRILVEARQNIISKVESMCKKWETRVATHGPANLIQEIEDQYQRNPKCKVAWGVQEVASARNTLNTIFRISKNS